MDVLAQLKKIYYLFEGGYYNILDKVNQKVPIYKVIDPIDKVFPSFILLIILIAFSVVLAAIALTPPQVFSATILVSDSQGNALEGVPVQISIQGQQIALETDFWGEAKLNLPTEEVEAEAVIEFEGFSKISETITLRANELIEFKLSAPKILLESTEHTIYVVSLESGRRRIISKPVQLEFSCDSGLPGPAPLTRPSGEFKNIASPNGCGTLIVKASAEGFEPKNSISITRKTTYIELSPIVTTTAITVLVRDHEGEVVSGAIVKLFDSDNAVSGQKTSDESGVALFEEIEAGTYSASAIHSDGRFAEKTAISARAGSPKTVSIQLPELLEGSKVSIRAISSDTDSAIGGAKVFLYANNRLIAQENTDPDGIFEKPMMDDAADLIAVISHDNFVTKIEPGVSIIEMASTNSQDVKLDPLTASNNSKAIVKVTDYETEETVEEASVFLYNSDYPELILNYPYNFTNADGNLLFSQLPAGSYFAKARKDNTGGQSETRALAAGSLVELPVVLVLTEGNLEVNVVDPKRGPLEGAEIKIFDAFTDAPLQSGLTDEDGTFESEKLKSDKVVYLKVSKANYITFVSPPIPIIAKDTVEFNVELIYSLDVTEEKSIEIEFAGFFDDAQAEDKASKLEAGQSYFLKFYLTLPQDANYDMLVNHLRVGPESVAGVSFEDYVIRVANDATSSHRSSTVFSTSFDSADPFSNPQITSLAAKQSNTLWENPESETRYIFIVKAETEQGLEDDTDVEIRYMAKVLVNGTEFATPEFLKVFRIGETICEPGINCPAAVWRIFLQEPGAEPEMLSNFSLEESVKLSLYSNYSISYVLHNTSGADLVATLEVQNHDPSGVIAIQGDSNAVVFEDIPIEADTVVDIGSPFEIETMREAAVTELRLRLKEGNQLLDEQTLYFKVEADANLAISLSPGYLVPNDGSQIISGIITEPVDGNPIANASVSIYLRGTELYETITTDANGFFRSSRNFNLPANSSVTVVANAPRYRDTEASIPVKRSDFFDQRYGCIEVEMDPSEGDFKEFYLAPNQTGSFTVLSNNCSENVEIRFNTKLVASPESFSLEPGRSRAVQFTADNPEFGEEVYLGQYPIYVQAKFESDVRFLNALKVLVYIADEEGSCLAIDKTSFNLFDQPKDSANLTNNCAVRFNDAWRPEIALDTFKALISRTDFEIPEVAEFDWSVTAKIQYIDVNRAIVEELEPGWRTFYVDTDRVATGGAGDYDNTVTVEIGNRIQNVEQFKFEFYQQEHGVCALADNVAFVKANTVTVNTPTGQQTLTVPCTETECTWDNADMCINNAEEGDCSAERLLPIGAPCKHGEFTVALNADRIDSIEIPIFNKDNNAGLVIQLYGDVVDRVVIEAVDFNTEDLVLGEGTSAIVPVKNLGYVLGTIDFDLEEILGGKIWLVYDVNFVSESESNEIETWIVDDTVYAKYIGNTMDANANAFDANTGIVDANAVSEIPFEITNLLLNSRQYNLIVVDDYVSELRS